MLYSPNIVFFKIGKGLGWGKGVVGLPSSLSSPGSKNEVKAANTVIADKNLF